ncbi:hypothetical protein HMPREF0765_0484 [Sphingobacterium spiritivorum ATCC 33300]|uniref:Uncharacterized protein n=1 Tax=Sphingobacterium spiritivorum ATCC 33300 TaxID=525372 RepID=C2FT28_SPHSI|nr:hypothetical protein [Sphingobacterium spiritivorum]EEI93862.1 hypothetical protein HMPREF0765_0484 [Sphingobacterium spiritivorum ATCC 33300]QQS94425.1 hypothetical protein I6J03_13580 [Sphingobacterium spiritivorum]
MKDKVMYNTMQEHWHQSELVGIDAIVFSDGSMKLIDISANENQEIKNTFGKEYHFSISGTTSLNEIIEKYDNDIWSVCQINDQITIDNLYNFVCGEGEMGNEGFIAKLDIDGKIVWSLYSTTSNPFCKLEYSNGRLRAVSTSNFAVIIDAYGDGITIDNYL